MRLATSHPCSPVSVPLSASLLSAQHSVGPYACALKIVSTPHNTVWVLAEDRVQITGDSLSIVSFCAGAECHTHPTPVLPSFGRLVHVALLIARAGDWAWVAQQFQGPLHLNACHGMYPTTGSSSSCSCQVLWQHV